MPPLISIVIPHFERTGLLRETLASIFASSDQRFEVIVVDDGSREEEWITLQAMAAERVRVLRREDGLKGPSRCRNLGWRASKGDLVLFLDSDDWMAPWCLEQRIAATEREPDADLWVFPVMQFHNQPGDLDLLWNDMDPNRDVAARFACGDGPWHTSSPLWRKAALAKLGGFNEAVFYGDDGDLHLRAVVTGLRASQYPEALPDVFVRRSEVPRITNSPSAALVDSRLVRLTEGTAFLRSHPDGARLLPLWEGQYFVEAEFLLFNHRPAAEAIRPVLAAWRAGFAPSWMRRGLVRGYFSWSNWWCDRCYLLVQLARRVAMKCLPASWFPCGGGSRVVPDAARLDKLKARLPAAAGPRSSYYPPP